MRVNKSNSNKNKAVVSQQNYIILLLSCVFKKNILQPEYKDENSKNARKIIIETASLELIDFYIQSSGIYTLIPGFLSSPE